MKRCELVKWECAFRLRVTLKDLERHKFPMDETEQALLIQEISAMRTELQKLMTKDFSPCIACSGSPPDCRICIKEILG